MTPLFIISSLILATYVIMVAYFLMGWHKEDEYTPQGDTPSVCISLVVCCRNEETQLPPLLQSIANQTYPPFECILIDDHSTDNTLQLLQQFATEHPNTRILTPTANGKKAALREAIAQTNGELICCTDADCILSPHHIETIADYYQHTHPDLILGAVKMHYGPSLFQKLQALEFLSLMGSGMGAAANGQPILANGANIAFTKQTWNAAATHLHDETPSGDDIFLLHHLKQQQGKILFLKNRNTIVTTTPCTTLRQFLNQRARWTSKSGKYRDPATIIVATIVLLTALLMPLWFIIGCCNCHWMILFLLFFFLKYIIDTTFMCIVTPFFGQEQLCRHTLLLSILYPPYILTSILLALIGKWKWKK